MTRIDPIADGIYRINTPGPRDPRRLFVQPVPRRRRRAAAVADVPFERARGGVTLLASADWLRTLPSRRTPIVAIAITAFAG
jgi:hypothetical protein